MTTKNAPRTPQFRPLCRQSLAVTGVCVCAVERGAGEYHLNYTLPRTGDTTKKKMPRHQPGERVQAGPQTTVQLLKTRLA